MVIKITDDIYEQLKKIAEMENTTIASLASNLLNEALKKESKELSSLQEFLQSIQSFVNELEQIKMNIEILQTLIKSQSQQSQQSQPQIQVQSPQPSITKKDIFDILFAMFATQAKYYFVRADKVQEYMNELKKIKDEYLK